MIQINHLGTSDHITIPKYICMYHVLYLNRILFKPLLLQDLCVSVGFRSSQLWEKIVKSRAMMRIIAPLLANPSLSYQHK